MKNWKVKSMLLGLASASIMTNAFAAEPIIIVPDTTVDVVNAAKGNVIISDAYEYDDNLDKISGKEPDLTVTKFMGNTDANSNNKVYILDGFVNTSNLGNTLNGSLLDTINGKAQTANKKSVVLAKDGIIATTSKDLFNKDKDAINENVAPYLELHSGYVVLRDDVAKADLLKYSDVLSNEESDTGLIVVGKLLDDQNKEIRNHSVNDAIDLADRNLYSLSTSVDIKGDNVNHVVFANQDDNGLIEGVKTEGNTMYIPMGFFAKSINFDKNINDVEMNYIGYQRDESIKKIYEDSGYKYDDMNYNTDLVLANTEQGGKAISGSEDLKITINDDSGLVFLDGPSNIVDANIQINHGHIDVDGSTATFKKEVMINEKELTDNIEEQGNVVLNDAKMVLDDELWLRPGTMYAENSVLEANNKVNVDLEGSVAVFVDSKLNIDQLLPSYGGAVVTENSDVNIKTLGTDDRFSSNHKFNNYITATNQVDKAEQLKKSIANETTVDFIDSNVKIKSMEIEGRGTVTFTNDKNDKSYDVDILNVYRGGKVELKGGTLKVNEFIGSSYIDPDKAEGDIKPEDRKVEGVLEGTYNPEGKIILSGGVLEANNLRALLTGELISDKTVKDLDVKPVELADFKNAIIKDKPVIELNDNAKLKTRTSQIFAKDASKGEKDSGAVTNKAVEYNAGTLVFTDDTYKGSYLNSAEKSLKDYNNASTTKIVMLGKELTDAGEVRKTIDLDTAVKRTEAGQTTITPVEVAEKDAQYKKLIIGQGLAEDTTKVSGGAVTASKLVLNKELNEIVVNSDKATVLGGTSGDILTKADPKQQVKVSVESTLQLGNSLLSGNKVVDTVVNADLNIKSGGTLDIQAADVKTGGTFATEANANISITNNGKLSLANNEKAPEQVKLGEDTTITVGDEQSRGELELYGVDLNGSKIMLDPVWNVDNGKISPDASIVKINAKDNTKFDGRLVVGQNSGLVLNSNEDVNIVRGANEAVLAVYEPITLDPNKGSIVVNPVLVNKDGDNNITKAPTPANTVTMANNSQLVTTANAILAAEGDGVISAGKFELPEVDAKDAKAYGVQAEISGDLDDYAEMGAGLENGVYLVKAPGMTNDFKAVNFDMGKLINLKSTVDGDGVKLVLADDKNKSVFNKVKDAFPKENILLTNTIDGALKDLEKAAKDSANKPDAKLATPATDALSFALAQNNRAQIINSMANMADLGGVTKESYNNLNKFTDTVENFSSERNLWATYTHSNNNSDVDLTGNKASYSAKSNGLVLGGSLAQNDKQNWGMAVFYNKGKVTANSGLQTKNDVRSYGIGFYATNKLAKGELVSQFAVSRNNNDLEQLGTKAKANTSNYSLAVKYQQPMAKANGTLTPYVGLRFAHLGGANFANSLGFKYNVEASNVVSMPFGVKYAGQVVKGNTTIAPFAELGYTPVLSGKNHKVTVGLNATDSFTNTVLDNTWHAKLGANITKGNNTFGLSYARVQGNQTKDNQFMATAEFKF